MKGSIRRQSASSWEVRVYVPNPSTGKNERRSFTVKGSKRDAQRFRATLVSDIMEGRFKDQSKVLVEDFASEWLETIKPTIRQNTHEGYSWTLGRYVLPAVGDTALGDVTPQQLNQLYAKLLGQGLTPRTVRYAHTVAHRMFRDAVKWGHLATNPSDQADPPRQKRSTGTKAWTEEEVGVFLDAVRDDELYPLWRLVVFTGLRRSEVLGLKWDNVEIDRKRLTVTRTLVHVKGGSMTSEPKTQAGRREVLLDKETAEVLREHYERQANLRMKDTYQDEGFVFTWEDGRPVKPDFVSKEFRRINDRLDLPRITFHGLRHTHASLLFRAAVPAKVAQERLGHSNIGITMDLYTHTQDDVHEQAADAVADLLDS